MFNLKHPTYRYFVIDNSKNNDNNFIFLKVTLKFCMFGGIVFIVFIVSVNKGYFS